MLGGSPESNDRLSCVAASSAGFRGPKTASEGIERSFGSFEALASAGALPFLTPLTFEEALSAGLQVLEVVLCSLLDMINGFQLVEKW
jgi:hypothetical protein